MSVQAPLPNTIANGDTPDATPLMANFNFLAAGKGIACGTYADLKTAAASAPTVPFIGFATDIAAFVGYCGDASHEFVARRREQADRPLPNFVADWKDREGVDEADSSSVATCPRPPEQSEDAGLCNALDDEDSVGKQRG